MASWKHIHEQVVQLPFQFDADRERIKGFLHEIGEVLKNEKQLTELSRIITLKGKELTGFDSGIFFDPRKLLIAIISSDIFGTLINHDEFYRLYASLENYVIHEQGVLEDKEWIESQYGIQLQRISEKTERRDITAQAVSETAFIVSIPRIKELISIYPPIFIKNIKLEKIVLASSFSKKHGSGPCIYLGGFESNEDHNIYLTVGQLHKSFHHEVYHQAMQHYDDSMERADLRSEKDHFYLHQHHHNESPGFAMNYGRENVCEDQATMAESMITNYRHMQDRAKHDRVLAQKMELVHKAMYELSDGKITPDWRLSVKE